MTKFFWKDRTWRLQVIYK